MKRIGLVCFTFVATIFGIAGCWQNVSTSPLVNEMYVWNRVWTQDVSESLHDATQLSSGWRVLVAQSNTSNEWKEFSPHLVTLVASKRPLTAVIRIDGQRKLDDSQRLIEETVGWYHRHSKEGWVQIEIDYDCPTSALGSYAKYLQDIRSRLPGGMRLSITVLPTWLESSAVTQVLNQVDQSVLQVHSILDPRQGLFSELLAMKWTKQFARLTSTPFIIALPDYGSKVSTNSNNQIILVSSEELDFRIGPNESELEADPVAIQSFLRAITGSHPSNLEGVIWFRLPVRGDRRIWSLRTLTSVMQLENLQPELVWKIGQDAQGAYQLALGNTGTVDTALPRTIRVRQDCQAADGIGDIEVYHEDGNVLFRPRHQQMLRIGDYTRIGWIQCAITPMEISVEN